MGSPPDDGAERRCPSCGALVIADAAWCGQCLTPLAQDAPVAAADEASSAPATEAAPAATTGPRPAAVATTAAPTWPCPVCEHPNPLDLDTCEVCGTPFAALMNQRSTVTDVTPKEAMRASLIFPGLGHRKLGYGLDGLARAALFVLLGGMALLIALGGFGSGMLLAIFAIYLILAVAVYVGSAVEARNLAQGGGLIVPTRQAMWAAVIVIMTSMGLLVVAVIATTKR